MANYTKRDLSRLETRRMLADMMANPYSTAPKPKCHCGDDPAWVVNTSRTRGDLHFCASHEAEAIAWFEGRL